MNDPERVDAERLTPAMSRRERNELWAGVLLDELVRGGLRQVVVAPGSRSTPLVMAAARRDELRVTVQIDERSAGFLALGVGKATGAPAAVVTTSGTAVANLLPAVVEAAQSEVPLLLLTADRPPRLRDADANQAIDQHRIFGLYPRFFQELAASEVSDRTLRHLRSVACRALAATVGSPAGPAHLNLPFEKPLEPTRSLHRTDPEPSPESAGVGGREAGAPFTRIFGAPGIPGSDAVERIAGLLRDARRPLLVAGPVPRPWSVGPALRRFAALWGVPLLADPLSGARYPGPGAAGPGGSGAEPHAGAGPSAVGSSDPPAVGSSDPSAAGSSGPTVVGGYDLVLRSLDLRRRLAPDLVIRVGQAPTSKRLNEWLAELAAGVVSDPGAAKGETQRVVQVVVDGGDRWKDHLAVADEVVKADPVELFRRLSDPPVRQSAWVGDWLAVDEALRPQGVAVDAGLRAPGGGRPRSPGSASGGHSVPPDRDPAAGMPPDAGPSRATPRGPVLHEGDVAARLVGRTPSDALLFVSSSMPVREVDTFAPHRSEPLLVLGNRGASGIDGIVSTAAGAALGTGRRVVALVGDLALLHDSQGLAVLREPEIRVSLVVLNNDGGGIFQFLPIREHEPAFTRYFATPHGLDLSHLAALYDLPHRWVDLRTGEEAEVEPRSRSQPQAEVTSALEPGLDWVLSLEGSGILEVRTDRESNHRLRDAAVARAAAASRGALLGS